jgi:hypothetical protein
MLLGEALMICKRKYKESLGSSVSIDDLANDNKKTFYINAANFSIQNKKSHKQLKAE